MPTVEELSLRLDFVERAIKEIKSFMSKRTPVPRIPSRDWKPAKRVVAS